MNESSCLLFSMFVRVHVPGYYDRRTMISAVFYLLPSIVSLSIGLTCFILLFWGIRCFCSNCSVALATKAEECQCCQEIDRCSEVMEQFGYPKRCITLHPGFKEVCLSKHVLEVAALGLKTKSGKTYKTMFLQGQRTEEE